MLGSQAKGLVLVCYHLLYGLPPHIMHLLILLEEKGRMGKSQLLGKYANQGRCTWLLWVRCLCRGPSDRASGWGFDLGERHRQRRGWGSLSNMLTHTHGDPSSRLRTHSRKLGIV